MTYQEAADIAALVKEWMDGPVYVVGSLRRKRPTVSNIDFLTVNPDDFQKVRDHIIGSPITSYGDQWLKFHAQGAEENIEVRVYLVPPTALGPALIHFTGSSRFCAWLRMLARSKNLHLTQYGLFTFTQARVDDNTEGGIFRSLGLEPFQRPEGRERG